MTLVLLAMHVRHVASHLFKLATLLKAFYATYQIFALISLKETLEAF